MTQMNMNVDNLARNPTKDTFMENFLDSPIMDIFKIGIAVYLFFLLVFAIVGRQKVSNQKDNTSTRERLYQRFLYTNFDLLQDLSEDQKKLMQTTFENTVQNAQQIDIQLNSIQQKRAEQHVTFNLEKNTYSSISTLKFQNVPSDQIDLQ